jgi:hypothetical protein
MTGSLASATAVIVAVTSLTAERRRYQDETRNQRIEQQTRVYAWLEPRLRESTSTRVWILRFENQTRVPIYDWTVRMHGSSDAVLSSDELGPIRPGASDLELSSLAMRASGQEPRVTLEFTDVEGTRWQRAYNGTCIEIAPNR